MSIHFICDRLKSRLPFHLVMWIITCSVFFMLLSSAFQLYFSHQRDIATIQHNLESIKADFLSSIAHSLYEKDKAYLRLQLKTLSQLRGIEYIEVVDVTKTIFITEGDSASNKDAEKKFELEYQLPTLQSIPVGIMTITVNYDSVYQRLWKNVRVVCISLMIQIFLTALFIVLIIRNMITRHLDTIVDYAKNYGKNELNADLKLCLCRTERRRKDVLDQVVFAFNDLMDRIRNDKKRQKEAEQLLQIQKKEAMGTFATGIVHDFNNTLSAIFSYIQLSQIKLPNIPESEIVTSYLDKAHLAGIRAEKLTKQILIFSGKGKCVFQKTNLGPILRKAVESLKKSIPDTISICCEIRPNLRNINGDPSQIHQIIMNLCNNALEAMEKSGGTLEVVLSNFQIKYKSPETENLEPGDYVVLKVCDSGIGMDEETKMRVFDPYYTGRKRCESKGLGLSIVSGIVEKHGGAIYVYSKPDTDTKFHVYLPVSKEDIITSVVKANEVKQELPTGSESVLLVDDEVDLATVYKKMLTMHGYNVQIATNSQDALNRFNENPDEFDLVITDFSMPKMNGLELSKKIHELKQGIPIILVSGMGEIIPEEDLIASGIKSKFSKPIKLDNFIRGVREILDS